MNWSAENQLRLCTPARSVIGGIINDVIGNRLTSVGCGIAVPRVEPPAQDAYSDVRLDGHPQPEEISRSSPTTGLAQGGVLADSFIIEEPAPTKRPPGDTYFKVCIIQDKSGSSQSFGTPQITARDLVPLFDQMVISGGEIGFGVLDENSMWPLKRMYVPSLIEPPEMTKGGNTQAQLENVRVFRSNLSTWIDNRDQRLARFQLDRDHFLQEIEPDLVRGLDALSSDVAGALVRCSRFLAEEDLQMSGVRFIPTILFISDVEHAISSAYFEKNPDADLTIPKPQELEILPNIYVVNGKKNKGSLAQSGYRVHAFEGIAPAIRAIVSSSQFDMED